MDTQTGELSKKAGDGLYSWVGWLGSLLGKYG
jgi:hypothetical protein